MIKKKKSFQVFNGPECILLNLTVMPRKSKSAISHIQNLGLYTDFYPKYHCELNFIEQYWGAAKLRYRNTTCTTNIVEMEENMIACLDDVPLIQIIRYGA